MKDEPNRIDVSSLSELVRIRREEDILRERLQKMESARERVSEVVFRRVRGDYEKRKAALEAEAKGPRLQAALEYRRLRELTLEAEKALQEAKFDLEEVDLRHELGEFPDDGYRERSAGCQKLVSERQRVLDEFGAMKAEFVKAFPSEDDLERAASSPSAAGGPLTEASGSRTAAMVVTPLVPGSVPPPPGPSPDATLVGTPPPGPARRTPPKGPAPPPAPGHAHARLVLLTDDKPEREYPLKRAPMSIGRSTENEIFVPFPDVSRVHATVVPEGEERFKLVDRGSPNGVIVNGSVVKEHLLSDGDVIQIGRRKLVFRG